MSPILSHHSLFVCVKCVDLVKTTISHYKDSFSTLPCGLLCARVHVKWWIILKTYLQCMS